MNHRLSAMSGLILGPIVCLLGGCAAQDSAKPAAAQRPHMTLAQSGSGFRTIANGQPVPDVQTPAANREPLPAPGDTQFTIACRTYEGRSHNPASQKGKDLLIKNKLDRGYIVHRQDDSILYYGFYPDRGSAERDLKKLAGVMDGSHEAFAQAKVVELNEKDPPAPAEWNLKNAKGYWSLEIAAFRESPERKQAAVDAVKEMRSKGIEGYFYHGPTTSSVCVGAWPRSAIREQATDGARTGSQNPDQPILVLPGPMDNLPQMFDRDTGEAPRIFAPKVDIVDESMKQAMRDYPVHMLNDHIPVRVNQQTKERVEDRSFYVVIPGAEEAYQASAHEAKTNGNPNQPAPGPLPPSMLSGRSSQTPGGRLRSVGE